MHTDHTNKLMRQQANELSVHLTWVKVTHMWEMAIIPKAQSVCSYDQKNKYFWLHAYVAQWNIWRKKTVSIQCCSIACSWRRFCNITHSNEKCLWEKIDLCSLVLLFLPQDYYLKLEKSKFRKSNCSTFSCYRSLIYDYIAKYVQVCVYKS